MRVYDVLAIRPNVPLALAATVLTAAGLGARPASADTPNSEAAAVSTNHSWAGYEATRQRGHFDAVRGEFTTPSLSCDSNDPQEENESFSQWVGLDGAANEELVQDGVEAHCVPAKKGGYKAVYYPWWEVIQGPASDNWRGRQFVVHPGDKIKSSVTYKDGRYTLSLHDKTTGEGFIKDKSCDEDGTPCPRVSAEWIVERPGGGNSNGRGGVLADFGRASFTHAAASFSGNPDALNLEEVHAKAVNMTDSDGTVLASTSSVGADDRSFSVKYEEHGTTSITPAH